VKLSRYPLKLILSAMILSLLASLSAKTVTVSTEEELYAAVGSAADPIHIIFRPGEYLLTPQNVMDTSLGNALNADSSITVTTGLHLVGKNVILEGANRAESIINTFSGYGIFIENCPSVIIKNLTIRNGTRDPDGNATSGAIVVKHSSVQIYNCLIAANQGDFSKTIAGIIGIAGREGSVLDIHNNVISNNSWDGIALYRGASAVIHDNLIHSGRGAGIGVTWDATAQIYRNVIHGYWKGIGSFGNAHVTACNNLVRDLRGWGIIASGHSDMVCHYNEVVRMGNVGIAAWDDSSRISITDNVIRQSGRESQWVAPLVGIWMNSLPCWYSIERNLLFDNSEADIAFGLLSPVPNGKSFTFARKADSSTLAANYIIPSESEKDSLNFLPKGHRLVLDMGDPAVLDPDGTRSDLGIFGGWLGKWDWDPDGLPFLKDDGDFGNAQPADK
jgi:hypothetical protein